MNSITVTLSTLASKVSILCGVLGINYDVINGTKYSILLKKVYTRNLKETPREIWIFQKCIVRYLRRLRSCFKHRTSINIKIYARYFRTSRFKNNPWSTLDIPCTSHTFPIYPFIGQSRRRFSSSKDTIILALVSNKVTTSDDKTESQFQDDATDTITRREMNRPTRSKGRNASARKVTMIIQTRDFRDEEKTRRLADKT